MDAEMMGADNEVTNSKWFKQAFFLPTLWEVRSFARGGEARSAPTKPVGVCSCVRVQPGAYYPGVTPDMNLKMCKFNYPDKGKTEFLAGVQCGGMCFTIQKDAEGIPRVSNFKGLLVDSRPQSFTCSAGTLTFLPGISKMYGKHGVVWGVMTGPGTESTVPKVENSEAVKVRKGKKLPDSSKVVELELPQDEKINVYWGRHQGANMLKTAIGSTMFELGADGESLERVEEGQADLLKLLKVPGLEVSLDYSKSTIPQKPKNVYFNLFVYHPEINGGKKIMLFTTAPMSGPPPHILQPGVLPGGKCLKDLADLPWTHELREVLISLVKPLVDFALALETVALASKWKKDITPGTPLVQLMARVHKQQDHERLSELLSCVKTRGGMVGGEWNSSGLLIELTKKAKKMIKPQDPSVVAEAEDSGAEGSEDSDVELWAEHAGGEDEPEVESDDSDDSDEDYGKPKPKAKPKAKAKPKPKAKPKATGVKRLNASSPAKSTRSSSGSSSSAKQAKKAKVAPEHEEEDLASSAEEESAEEESVEEVE